MNRFVELGKYLLEAFGDYDSAADKLPEIVACLLRDELIIGVDGGEVNVDEYGN